MPDSAPAYTAIKEARTELLRTGGLLDRFAHDEVRVVVRPTWIYASLLDESTHPDLMKDAAERHEVLALLGTDTLGSASLPGLLDEEIAQLWSGDVPLFTALPERTDLWSGTGRMLPGTLARTGLSLVRAKLAAMGAVDRQDQERIIRAAMVTTSREPAHEPRPGPRRVRTAATAPDPDELLAAARSVGDGLVSQAYSGPTRLNWIGLELLDERYWRLGPMAADLAGGYTGTACFLAQLAALTGADRYAAAARDALAPLAGLLDVLHSRPDDLGPVGSGAFAGIGGIAYALTQVADVLDDPCLGGLVLPALRLTGAAAVAESEYGVRGGTAAWAGRSARRVPGHRAGRCLAHGGTLRRAAARGAAAGHTGVRRRVRRDRLGAAALRRGGWRRAVPRLGARRAAGRDRLRGPRHLLVPGQDGRGAGRTGQPGGAGRPTAVRLGAGGGGGHRTGRTAAGRQPVPRRTRCPRTAAPGRAVRCPHPLGGAGRGAARGG